jgi:hypothetical protein
MMSLSNLQVHLFLISYIYFWIYNMWCISAKTINLFFKFHVISQFPIKIVWLQYMNTLMKSRLLCCWFQFSLSLKIRPSWNIFLATPLPKMMFGSLSELFANLRHIKRCNSCVSGLNALFRGIEVAMHPFYSGWPKIMFGGVLDHFANLRT